MSSKVGVKGTISYAAPECLDYKLKNERTEKVDVFSYSVILWELVTGKIAWQGESPSDIKDVCCFFFERARNEILN
jgi:serine/threonine protein kinase